MDFEHHQSFILNDKSYSSLIKKEIRQFAEKTGFNKTRTGEIDIIVSEITSNLFKHARSGQQVLFKKITKGKISGLEIIALDNGPGIREPIRMQEDGVSTAGSFGHGLGAIKRLSHEFDLYSQPGWGTILMIRYYNEASSMQALSGSNIIDIRAVLVPKPGETACGDGWIYKTEKNVMLILATDGLGHGPDAEKASLAAADCYRKLPLSQPITEQLESIHYSIKQTRGVVGAILKLDMDERKASFCGIGNISSKVVNLEYSKTFMSYNGIIGLNKPTTLNEQEKTIESGQIFILCSDGLKTRWELSKYPHLIKHDSSVIAAALYKDHARRTDDTMVIVAKVKKK